MSEYYDGEKISIDEMRNDRNSAIARAEKAEAGAAAMRSALIAARDFVFNQPCPKPEAVRAVHAACEAALASDAGAALLAAHKAEVWRLVDALAAGIALLDLCRAQTGPDCP